MTNKSCWSGGFSRKKWHSFRLKPPLRYLLFIIHYDNKAIYIKNRKLVYKPGSVHPPNLTGRLGGRGNHSSGMLVTKHLWRPTLEQCGPHLVQESAVLTGCNLGKSVTILKMSLYLALLQVGFTLPSVLPQMR